MMNLATHPQAAPTVADPAPQRRKLTKLQVAVGVVSGLLALGLAAYSFYGSYESIKSMAVKFQFKTPELVPIGIDGGLLGAVLLDLFTTWIGHPIGLLRMSSRFFTAGTVVVNAMAGWSDGAEPFDNVQAITLHVFAPILLLVMVESLRHLLMEMLRMDDEVELRDTVGVANWFLRPWPAFLIWRRMKVNKIGSYTAAQDMELRRLQAIGRLKSIYPGRFRAWRKMAPPDLVYKLTRGFRLEEACDEVALMSPGTTRRERAGYTPGTPSKAGSGTPSRSGSGTPSVPPSGYTPGTPSTGGSGTPSGTPSRAGSGTPSGRGSGTPSGTPSGTGSGTGSGTPSGTSWGTPDGLSDDEVFERRIEIIKHFYGDEIPGVRRIRDTLRSVGWGVGQDGPHGAQAIRNAMYLRAGLKPPTDLVGSVNGSTP